MAPAMRGKRRAVPGGFVSVPGFAAVPVVARVSRPGTVGRVAWGLRVAAKGTGMGCAVPGGLSVMVSAAQMAQPPR